MGNIHYITGLIALLQLGCVLSQVTWLNEGATIIVREGTDTNVEIVCNYKVPSGDEYSWIPHLYKIQDLGYVEEQLAQRQEIDGSKGLEVAVGSGVKLEDEYVNILEAKMETSVQGLQAGEIKLIVKIFAPLPRDSGKYVCEAANGGETFQIVHSLIVLPRASANALTVTLSGMTDVEDNATMFKETGNMIYYGNENNNPYGMIECRACDGASEPVITMTIGDMTITGSIPEVEDVMMTWEGDAIGMQTIHRCVARRHSRYQLTGDHNGKELTCAATVNTAEGEEFASAEVKRAVLVYHAATKQTEGCDEEQFSPRGRQGQIQCMFSAVPSPKLVIFKKDGQEYDTDVQSGAGWSAVVESVGEAFKATLNFDEVEDDHFGTYYLSVMNDAGTREIEITFEEGESQTGGSTGGVSGLQFSLSLISASLFLAWKLLL